MFITESGPFCGNGIVEDGEDCDSGFYKDETDSCCIARNTPGYTEKQACKLKPNAVCRYNTVTMSFCLAGFFSQDFGNMTHTHGFGNFSDVLFKIRKKA
jgi:hypothetical protein